MPRVPVPPVKRITVDDLCPIRPPAAPEPYRLMVDRARSGEPVAIETSRPDFHAVIDFLTKVDGHGLLIQCDTAAGLLWLSQSKTPNAEARP